MDFHFAVDLTSANGDHPVDSNKQPSLHTLGVYAKLMEELETIFGVVAKSLSAFGAKAAKNRQTLDFIQGGDCSFGAANAYRSMPDSFILAGPANYEQVIKRVRPNKADMLAEAE